MKKIFSLLISVLIIAATLSTATLTAGAAEDELVINGEATVKVGDVIKFTLNLSDTKENIIGFDMRLVYDRDYLEFDEDKFDLPKFAGYFFNSNYGNIIPIVWTSINEPADFSKKDEFLSAEFKVLKGGETEISKWITDMYGNDMTYLKSYTWTYDISVDGKTIVSDKVPPVSSDEDTLSTKQGSYTNYKDGMGEENSPNSGDAHEAVRGLSVSQEVTEVVEVTKYVGVNGGEMNISGYLIIGALVLLGGLIVAGVVIVKKKGKSGENEDDLNEIPVAEDEIE